MRKQLIPKNKNFYKANLNCKSNSSSGRLSARELKEAYQAEGYSVIAFCDDNIYDYNELCDNNFLIIPAYHTQIDKYSLNLYSTIENNSSLCKKITDNSSDIQKNINIFIDNANKCGFLVSLEHPCKSMITYHDCKNINGLFGIEIANYASYIEGNLEDNNHIYDRILRNTTPAPLPLACDGNKNINDFNSPNNDSFGALIYIYADELNLTSIVSALKNGDFYASTGPVFEEIYIENNKIHIKCSPVSSIRLLNEGRDAPVAIAKDGELITEAVFDIDPFFCGRFIRVDIRDDNGNFADTVPYYIDKL